MSAVDRDRVLHLAAQRAGWNERQLDALRRRDYETLLSEQLASPRAPDPHDDLLTDTPPRDLRADVQRLTRRLTAVRQQRDAALHMVRQLAARLGCCPDCWGTDASCATCGGAGSPGHFPSDPRLGEWLAPALARETGVDPYDTPDPDPDPPPGWHEPARPSHAYRGAT